MKKGGKKIHFIEKDSIDINKRTATCSKCGKIDIRVRKNLNGTLGWRCFNSHRDGRNKYKDIKFLPKKTLMYGVCPICKLEKKLVFDHSHSKKEFRAFICQPCNLVLGFSKESTQTLVNAAEYLRSYQHA